jgi:hypothetical protein
MLCPNPQSFFSFEQGTVSRVQSKIGIARMSAGVNFIGVQKIN